MLQILILAGVAVFLFWRLYLILGVRSGFENSINPKNKMKQLKSETGRAALGNRRTLSPKPV